MPTEVTLSPFSALRQSYGLNRPVDLATALSALYMQSEADLIRAAGRIIDANPFGLTYAAVRKYLMPWLDGASVELQQGVTLLVFLYVDHLRPHKSPKDLPPAPLRLYGNHPSQPEETEKHWIARCRAYIVQYMRVQVEAGEIRTSAEHKRLFAQYTASVGDLKAGESVWYNLRIQTGAIELLVQEKEARERAREQARAVVEAARQSRMETRAEAQQAKAAQKQANLAAMHTAWAEAREAKAEAKRQAARKETTARYRASKKTITLTAPEHLRAAANLIQTTQPQLAERLDAIAGKLEADKRSG